MTRHCFGNKYFPQCRQKIKTFLSSQEVYREDKDGGEAKTAWEAEREQAKGNVLMQKGMFEEKGNVWGKR